MMPGRLLAIVLCAVLAESGGDRGVDVGAVARDGRVYVSSSASEGLMRDLDQPIQAGLSTTITYDADLREEVGIWFDRTIASATVDASVQYDTLTRRYQLSRSVDGRIGDSKVTEDKAEVKRFALGFDRLPLFSTGDLAPNGEYYVRVRVRTRPRVTFFFWPWGRDAASGIARFTFIP
ncbi:MAG: DUF4390 domain-containing protein [Vicinamibacterales bacterium]|jgi:hypothetical protein|nr:DUF4390 domain-containing protein [Vicinamibacterales bacterium]